LRHNSFIPGFTGPSRSQRPQELRKTLQHQLEVVQGIVIVDPYHVQPVASEPFLAPPIRIVRPTWLSPSNSTTSRAAWE
jgi:hypothetical protein